ncbi:monocarboxylate transporter 5-like isoform X2 [Argopecten irradians]|uniref:monocarboxylate transporter 5-like isoform X2 n=1 Tax=Argopecten irradians TaxID=31199 RepID=UPI003713B19C
MSGSKERREFREIKEDNLSQLIPDSTEHDTAATDDDDDDDGVPIDHGWAWVVLVASTVINILYAGVLKSFGILFIEILDVYGGTVSTTSLITGLQFTVYCTTNLVVMMVLLRYQSVRTCQVIGILFSASAYILSSLTTRLELLIVCQSILNGTSIAFIIPTGIVLIGRYFRARIGLANGIFSAGLSLGGLVMPPLIQFIVEKYTLHGALLLTSGVVLNALPAAILQRPHDFFRRIYMLKRKSSRTPRKIMFSDSKCSENRNTMDILHKESKCVISEEARLPAVIPEMEMLNGETDSQLTAKSLPDLSITKNRKVPIDFINHREMSEDKVILQFSSVPLFFEYADVSSFALSEEDFTAAAKGSRTVQIYRLPQSRICTVLTQCKDSAGVLLKNKLFFIFIGFYTFGTVSGETSTLYLPPFAKENGIDGSQIAALISINSICDLIGKILSGYLADRHWLKIHDIILVSQIFTALLPQFNSFYDSFLEFSMFSAILGSMSGVIFALSIPLLREIVGEKNFAPAIGITVFIRSVILSGIIPLLGYLRDVTGTYHVTFHCMGATSFVSVCMLFLLKVYYPKCSL